MAVPVEASAMMSLVLEDVKNQHYEIIEKVLGEAIKKGILIVRSSDPVLVMEYSPDKADKKVRLMQSAVIDYQGAEKIEELEKGLEYMKKVNADLHSALSDFYERTKENTWLKAEK